MKNMKNNNLNSKEIIKKLEKNSKDICKHSVKKIGLFGSFLKNKQQNKSDIDIVVSFNNINYDNYIELKFLLENLFKKNVDLTIEKDLKSELKYITKEAKYARL